MRVSKIGICATVVAGIASLCFLGYRSYSADRNHCGHSRCTGLRGMVHKARAHIARTGHSAFPDFADRQAVVMFFAEETERFLHYLKENDTENHVKHFVNAMIAYPQSEQLDRPKSGYVIELFKKRLKELCSDEWTEPNPSGHTANDGRLLYLQ